MGEETQVHDELDSPFKRSRLKHQNGLALSSLTNSSPSLGESRFKKPKMEADELDETSAQHQPREITACQGINSEIKRTETESVSSQPLTRNKGKQPVSPKSLAVPERSFSSQPAAAHGTHPDVTSRTESDSNSSSMRLRDKGKEPLLPQNVSIDFRLISERSSQGVCIREPKVDSSISLLPKQKVPDNRALIKPKDGSFTDYVPQFEVPIPVVHRGIDYFF